MVASTGGAPPFLPLESSIIEVFTKLLSLRCNRSRYEKKKLQVTMTIIALHVIGYQESNEISNIAEV